MPKIVFIPLSKCYDFLLLLRQVTNTVVINEVFQRKAQELLDGLYAMEWSPNTSVLSNRFCFAFVICELSIRLLCELLKSNV